MSVNARYSILEVSEHQVGARYSIVSVAETPENTIVARYSIVTVSRTPTILTLTVTPQ